MFTVLSEPMEVIVLKKLYMLIGIDEPERKVFMRASWISGASTMSQLNSGASRVQVAAAKWVDIDPRKIGRTARGAPIVGREALTRDEFTLVAVGARGARDEVRRWLLGRGFVEGDDFLCVS